MNRILMTIVILGILCFVTASFVFAGEGYVNQPPPNKPDDLQFYACHDYSSNKNLGNNNYKLKKHGISEPLQGTYSYFLNTYDIRNYDEIFHAPICEQHNNFRGINNLNTPEILDHEDLLKEDELLKKEEIYDRNAVKDPYYLFGHPSYVGNKLIYSKGINDLFLSNHSSS